MEALWKDYLSDRTNRTKRDALVLAIRSAVVAKVYKSFHCCNRQEVESDVSLYVLEQVGAANAPIDVDWLAGECRRDIQRRARNPHKEEKFLREMTEAFGHKMSEWPREGDASAEDAARAILKASLK